MRIIERIKYYYSRIPNIPKTILFNFYYLPWHDAIHFPIYVGSGVKILNLGDRNAISIGRCTRGSICIGTSKGAHAIADKTGCWDIEKSGKVVFNGSCSIASGGKIVVKSKGKLVFGNDCTFNANSLIVVKKEICFGNDCMASWNTSYLDDDGHKIMDAVSGKEINMPSSISLGDHVWIGEGAQILKGVTVERYSVVAAGAMVVHSNQMYDSNVILAGVPAKVIKKNINWSRESFD